MENRVYIAIDLKSFYASVECVLRELDPLTTNLVVADPSRTEKTICLAVSPSLKAYGVPGRPRLFEVVEKVRQVNALRQKEAPGGAFAGASVHDPAIREDPSLALDYIVAPPQMARYMEISTRIYQIYLQYIAPEDIHIYSIDEVFLDATHYLKTYGMSPKEFARSLIQKVLAETGITATAGIGPNLYLCKIAMDIEAKHIPPDKDGVRIAELTERSYREKLWSYRPLTDFWRVGPGYARKLEAKGLYTMGDIARCSVGKETEYYNEDLLYKMFGVNAELLIDHAWGYEPCTIADIKSYRPETNSISSGQVLQCPYDFTKGRLIVREMTDLLVLDLVKKGLVTNQIVLTAGYDIENFSDPKRKAAYHGEITRDRYGRFLPKNAHGTQSLPRHTSSTRILVEAAMALYDRIVDPNLLIRRVYVVAGNVLPEAETSAVPEQLSLFESPGESADSLSRERKLQQAVLGIQEKFGKNAIIKGMNLQEGATSLERNNQIGGHRAK